MLTIISFLLTILGCINWLLVGLLQYDFVAGIFGFQASMLSRIVYIIIGVSALFLVYKLIKGKGTIAVFSRRNKKDLAKNIQKMNNDDKEEVKASKQEREEYSPNLNVEASQEFDRHDDYGDYSSHSYRDDSPKGLFNEHFNDDDYR